MDGFYSLASYQGPCPRSGLEVKMYSTPLNVIFTALKFSISPYLDNHLSESIHTWYPVGLAFIP